jgi:lipopolysaccharide export system permease protein
MATDRSQMQNLFIAQLSHDKNDKQKSTENNWTIITAAKGHQITDNQTGNQFMVATNGYRYQGIPGEKNYRIVKYDKYGIRLNTPNITYNQREETISTNKLFKNARKNPNYMAELQWRFSFPISTLILALLAIPLSRVNPRHGRFAQLIPAILIYIFYANMVFISRNWLKTEMVPAWIGIWWVHALMLSLALYLITKRNFKKRKA